MEQYQPLAKIKMAETSVVVEDITSNVNQGSVVAPPKFVFDQNMSERVENQDTQSGNPDSDYSPQEESVPETEEGNRNSVNKKRAAEIVDDKDVREADGPLSPVKKAAKVYQSSLEENDEPKQFILKPSILNEVAKNLTGVSKRGENANTTSSLPKVAVSQVISKYAKLKGIDISATGSIHQKDEKKIKLDSTFGLSTSESSSTETRKGAIAPEPITGQNKNYFQMFLDKNDQANDNQKSGSFVFGRNMGERVVMSAADQEKEINSSPEKQEGSQSTEAPLTAEEGPKTLAEVAKACAEKEGPDTPHASPDKQQMTLAEAAIVYQKNAAPCKSQLEEVEVVTGEEKERNVMHINCKLFLFDAKNHSWREKGRGFLRLNDMHQSTSESTFQSRLVMRTQGHLRVMLNTKLWPEMTLDRANDKSLRITAMEAENDVKIYLIMAGPKDIQRLYTAIDRRVQALRQEKMVQNENKSNEDSAKTDNDKNEEKKEEAPDGSSSKDSRDASSPDGSSNDSCSVPEEPARSKDNFSDDE